MDESARPRADDTWLRSLYVVAVIIGPIAWIWLWLAAFGFSGVQIDAPGAIPGWVALAIAPAIGVFLGWRLPSVEGSRKRILLATSVAILLVAIPFLLVEAGNYLALFGLAVLYAIGPVLLGRFLRLARATVGKQRA